jgi:predicted dithiol-disulfide oxidoreductase (DUF899 family)
MKLKLIALGAILFLAQSCKKSAEGILPQDTVTPVAQSAVPTAVVNTFASRFTGATQVEWFSVSTSSSSREFEVEFNHSSQRHGARYDNNGVEKRHGVSCLEGPVPQVVLTAFRATHATELVYEWKLRNDSTWKAHYFKGTVKWEATYTAAGVLIKDEIA